MNVWLMLIEHRIGEDRKTVLGPFTAVAFESGGVMDTLTGTRILRYGPVEGSWQVGDGRTGHFDRIVVQQGGFDSPRGEVGK